MYSDELFFSQTPICPICRKAVPLNNAKTDEDGNAIHEACYLVKLGVAPGAENNLKVSNQYLLRPTFQKRHTWH
jgi:hypothetical protein